MGLGQVLGYSLAILKAFYFAKIIWQLILENGDDRLDKIFSDNFRKIKIGFNKIIFVAKKICDACC